MTAPGELGNATIPKRSTFSPLALTRLVWILWLVLLVALGFRIITFALGDLLQQTNPSLAVLCDSGQSVARVLVAEQLRQEDEARVDDAVSNARAALRSNPFSARALSVLGDVSVGKNDAAQATILFQRANRAALRDLTPQIWLLQSEINAGDIAAVMERVDVILRANDPRVLQPLLTALIPLVTDERFRSHFVGLLQANTPWRKSVLRDVTRGTKDIRGLNALFTSLQASNAPPDTDEMKEYLERLVREGWLDQAYLAWSKFLPPERFENMDYLYNARFQYPLSNLPFDWLMPEIQGAIIAVTTESSLRILNIDFFGGRVRFANVSHILALAPGSYKFSGQERAQNLLNDRGLRWRIYCMEDPNGSSLGVSDVLKGERAWRELSIDFEVPEDNCRYQNLLLELPAQVVLDTEISGGVSYSALKLQPQ